MKEYYFSGEFAGIRLIFAFRHSDTVSYFRNWLSPVCLENKEDISPAKIAENNDCSIIRIPVSDCDCWIQDYGMKDDGNTEFGMSVYRASDVMLKYNRCVIHGAAMLWHDKAWLFIAESGTGKSTQLSHWKRLYHDEVQIMNGDKPILQLEESCNIRVHPSPWKGKEEWGDDTISAPLGGIILLKQGSENQIHRITPVYCAARLLSLFFSAFETEESLHQLCQFEDELLRNVPVWLLTNLGDPDSACLTHETLLKEGM